MQKTHPIEKFINEFLNLVVVRNKLTYNSLFGLLGFTITFAAIIISINSEVFKQYDNSSLKKYNFRNPIDIVSFSKDQLRYVDEQNEYFQLSIPPMTDKVKHILLVDLTTDFEDESSQSLLYNSLDGNVGTGINATSIDDLPLQVLLALKIIDLTSVHANLDTELAWIHSLPKFDVPINVLREVSLKKLGRNDLEKIKSDLAEIKSFESNKQLNKYFDEILSCKKFQDLFSDDMRYKNYVLTIISDFNHLTDKSHSLDQVVKGAWGLKNLVNNTLNGNDAKLQINLLNMGQTSSSPLLEKLNEAFKQDYYYRYEYDQVRKNFDQYLPPLVSPTTYDEQTADIFLFRPIKSIDIPLRGNQNNSERKLTLKEGRYSIWIPKHDDVEFFYQEATENNWKDKQQISQHLPNKIFDAERKVQNVKFSFEGEFDEGRNYYGLEVYNHENNSRRRYNLWPVQPLTRTGAFFYGVSVITTIFLIWTLLAFFLVDIFLVFKLFIIKEKKNRNSKTVLLFWRRRWIASIVISLAGLLLCAIIFNGVQLLVLPLLIGFIITLSSFHKPSRNPRRTVSVKDSNKLTDATNEPV